MSSMVRYVLLSYPPVTYHQGPILNPYCSFSTGGTDFIMLASEICYTEVFLLVWPDLLVEAEAFISYRWTKRIIDT